MLDAAGTELPDLADDRRRPRRGRRVDRRRGTAFLAGATAAATAEADRRAARARRRTPCPTSCSPRGPPACPRAWCMTHARTLRVATDWVAMTGLTDARPLPDGQPVLPHVRPQGRHPRLRGQRGRPCSPSPCSTPTGRWRGWPRSGITVFPGAPTLYQSILDHPDRGRHDLSSLRVAVTGAADIPVELIRRIDAELPFSTIITGYGLTEGGTVSATVARRRPRDDRHHRRPAPARLRGAHRRRRPARRRPGRAGRGARALGRG